MTRFTLILDDAGEKALKTLVSRAESAAKAADIAGVQVSRNALIQSLIIDAAHDAVHRQTGPK